MGNDAVQVYALFRTMDVRRNGFVSRREFVATFANYLDAPCCPDGHYLKPSVLKAWQGHILISECDECRKEIDRDAKRLLCDLCGYDICSECGPKFESRSVRRDVRQS